MKNHNGIYYILIFNFLCLSTSQSKELYNQPIVSYSIQDICDESNINNMIFNYKNLNGKYNILIKNKKNNYSLKIIFKNNYFYSLNLYDNNKKIGFNGLERSHILEVSCDNLYSNISKCYKDKIISGEINKYETIRKLCSNNLNDILIPKTNYFDNIIGKYLFTNGFSIEFINDIFNYKDKVNNGIIDY